MSDYILVKNNNGEWKYYKDGKFFEIDEVDNGAERPLINQNKASVFQAPLVIPTRQPRRGPFGASQPDNLPAQAGQTTKQPNNQPTSQLDNQITRQPANDYVDVKIDLEIGAAEHRETRTKSVKEKVDEVIGKLKIKFSDARMETRFRNLLETYFRGVRTEKEVEYALALPKSSGGLELPADKAKLVNTILKQVGEDNLNQAQSLKLKDQSKFKDENLNNGEAKDMFEPVEAKNMPVTQPLPVRQPVVDALPIKKVVPVTPIKPTVNPMPTIKSLSPKINDIKKNTRLFGPIEELSAMGSEEFRKLGRNKVEIANELVEKIQLLADESLPRKVEGINAWRRSPVYQLYLSMSMQGIREGKSIQAVIENRQQKNEETLTLSEYEAVNEINGKINE